MTLTTTYTILLDCLLAYILITYVQHLANMYSEVKLKKEKGEKPLTGITFLCLMLAFATELGVSLLCVLALDGLFPFESELWFVALFILIYLIRNAVAYLVVWAYWKVIVKLNEKQVKKELLDEIGEG